MSYFTQFNKVNLDFFIYSHVISSFIMSITAIDFVIYLAFSLLSGYVVGFLTVKFNHLLVIILGKLWSSGNAQRRYFLVGILASLVFASGLFLIVSNELETILSMTFVFAAMFALGIKHAMKRFGEYLQILDAIIRSLFHGEETSEDLIKDTLRISQRILKAMPKSQLESLKILFFEFDTAFMVFGVSLLKRKFRFSRFINLSKQDQIEYMHTWSTTKGLFLVTVAMKAIISLGYYTSSYSWNSIEYNGETLRRSFVN